MNSSCGGWNSFLEFMIITCVGEELDECVHFFTSQYPTTLSSGNK